MMSDEKKLKGANRMRHRGGHKMKGMKMPRVHVGRVHKVRLKRKGGRY